MLLVTRVFAIMQLSALFRCSRVSGLRFPTLARTIQLSENTVSPTVLPDSLRNQFQNSRSTRLFSTTAGLSEENIVTAIGLKGDEIRQLKASKAGKDAITPVVAELLQLKKDFEILTGNPFDLPKEVAAPKASAVAPAVPKGKSGKKEDAQSIVAKGIESSVITPRETDYSAWYVLKLIVSSVHKMVVNSHHLCANCTNFNPLLIEMCCA